MAKKKKFQVVITRIETVTYTYQIEAESKSEAKKIALSGEVEHGHWETKEQKIKDVEVDNGDT